MKKIAVFILLIIISVNVFGQRHQKNLTKDVVSSSEWKEMEKIFLETKAEIAEVFKEVGIKINTRKKDKTPLFLMGKSFGVSLKDKDIQYQMTERWISALEIYDDIRNNQDYILYSSEDLKIALSPVYEEIKKLRDSIPTKQENLVSK